jgi:hypothetical protein
LNFIFGIVCLFVCVCAFSLRRESPNMILGDKPFIFEVVLSHTGTIVDDDLLHIRHNSPITVRERLPDPMLLEALLMNQRSNAGWSSSPSPSSIATPQLIINHHFPTEEIKTPKLLRSEEEHMVGQELIKALGSFKHMFVGPCLPNKTLHLGRNQVWCVCKALIASISIEISKSSLERQPSRLSTIY